MPHTDVDAIVVLVTAPSEEVAERVARALLEARAAACVAVLPGVRSLYRWEGELHDDREVQLFVKTRAARLDDVKRVVKETHPYEVPELLALSVVDGAPSYLEWLRAETS